MLIAVDSSVLLDEELGDEGVVEALAMINWRLKDPGMIVLPSVIEDLEFQAQNFTGEAKTAANGALRNLLERGYKPINLIPAGHGIVEQAAFNLRRLGCLPDDNETDALIIAESALIGCDVLLTSVSALLEAGEHCHLQEILSSADLCDEMTITTPQMMVEKFFKHGR